MKKSILYSVGLLIIIVCVILLIRSHKHLSSNIVAIVNDQRITKQDFLQQFNTLPPQFRMQLSNLPSVKQFLDNEINQTLIVQEAKKEGIDKSPEIEAAVKAYRDNLIKNKLLEKFYTLNPAVTDAQLQDYYQKNLAQFTTKEMVKVSVIRVNTQKEADRIHSELSRGSDFATLARQYSTDPATKSRNGEMGWLTRDQYPFITNVAFSLPKVGGISKPVAFGGSFWIIKVTGKQQGGKKDFQSVKIQVKQRYIAETRNTAYRTFITDLTKKASIRINESALKSIIQSPAIPQKK